MNEAHVNIAPHDSERKRKTEQISEHRRAALEYAERGWHVVDLRPNEKRPLSDAWQKLATTDPTIIFHRWQMPCGVGVKLGPQSGIIDVESDSPEAEQSYFKMFGNPSVPTYRAARGCHRLFKYDPRLEGLGIEKIDGLEFRIAANGKGFQSAFPPSWCPNHDKPPQLIQRRWLAGLSPQDVELGTLPEAIIANLVAIAKEDGTNGKRFTDDDYESALDAITIPNDERARQARLYLKSMPGAVQGKGTGADKFCFALAIDVVQGFALPYEHAVDVLYDWGRRDDQLDGNGYLYPWSHAEISHKVNGAIRAYRADPIGDKLSHQQWKTHELHQREAELEAAIIGMVGTSTESEHPTHNMNGESEHRHETPDATAEPDDFCAGDSAVANEGLKNNDLRKYTFAPIGSRDLALANFKVEWLIRQMLVKGQPAIIGGHKKVLKTNMLVDINLSFGSGHPFLGTFPTTRTRSVLISGESGEFTIQETARRICRAKQLDLETLDCMWDFRLPKVGRHDELTELARGIKDHGIQVVIIDPIYLCLLAETVNKNAGNIFDMGPLLLDVSQACLEAGATPILCHHARKMKTAYDFAPLDLEDLAFAGIQEFARQWLLISRRERYELGSGLHKLWLSSGGSVGHGSLWGVDIDEGVLRDDFTGRRWLVHCRSAKDVQEERAVAKAEKENQKVQDAAARIITVLKTFDHPPARNALRERVGMFKALFDSTMATLEVDGRLEIRQGKYASTDGKMRDGNYVFVVNG